MRLRRLAPAGRDAIGGQSDVVDRFLVAQATSFLRKRLDSQDFDTLEDILSGKNFFADSDLESAAGSEDRRSRRGSGWSGGATDSSRRHLSEIRHEIHEAAAKNFYERFPDAARIGHV
jgi:hypothetical protein